MSGCGEKANAGKRARLPADWLTDGVFYQIFLRSFTPEGTLRAAMERLPQVAQLGVNIIYLCPICAQDDDMRREFWSKRQKASGFENPKNPYRIKDYFQLDLEYGTDDDLRAFVAKAHGLGLKVILDIVFYHCGPTAPLIGAHPDFVKRDEKGAVKNGGWNFPELNYDCPQLREYMWSNLEYWVRDFDVDGYRCDVSDAVPLDFWEEGRRRMERIKPAVIMLAEGERPEDQHYAFDIDYCFTLTKVLCAVFAGTQPTSAIQQTWEKMNADRPAGSRFIRYLDNHDLANDGGELRREREWGSAGVEAALHLIFTLDGVPFLYNGQEIADAAKHSIFARLPVDWTRENQPLAAARRELVTRLCALRTKEAALRRGELTWLDHDCAHSALAFVRTGGGESVLTAVNLGAATAQVCAVLPSSVAVAGGKVVNILSASSGAGASVSGGKAQVTLPALGYCVVKLA